VWANLRLVSAYSKEDISNRKSIGKDLVWEIYLKGFGYCMLSSCPGIIGVTGLLGMVFIIPGLLGTGLLIGGLFTREGL